MVPLGPATQLRWHRGTADEHRVERAQRLGPAGVVQQPEQLGGHQAGVAALPGLEPRGGGDEHLREEAVGEVHRDGAGAGIQRPQQHLQAGDVVGRQREQPLPRAAEVLVRGPAARAQGAAAVSSARLGVPVEPEVPTTTASPSGRSAGSCVRHSRWRCGRGEREHRGVARQRRGEAGQDRQAGRPERHRERLRHRHQWMWSRQSAGTRPRGPGTDWSAGSRGGGREGRPVHHRLVAVVPEPVLARLEALHDAVPGGGGVRRGVLGRRAVAAADVAARGAPAQVHPPAGGIGGVAVGAPRPARRRGRVDEPPGCGLAHRSPPSRRCGRLSWCPGGVGAGVHAPACHRDPTRCRCHRSDVRRRCAARCPGPGRCPCRPPWS